MIYGFTLARIFVINLLKFCAFFFPLFHAVVQYLFICTLLHLSGHLETGPALLSLSVNKWTCIVFIVNTLAKMFPKKLFFKNYNIINTFVRCAFSLFLSMYFVVGYLFIFLMLLCPLFNCSYGCCASKLIKNILYFVDRASRYSSLGMTNLTHFLIYLFVSSLYMFRASECSSSGDRIVLIHHLVLLVCIRVCDCLVCWSGFPH
jgi:hypothetical protein